MCCQTFSPETVWCRCAEKALASWQKTCTLKAKTNNMKKLFFVLLATGAFACNNSGDTNAKSDSSDRPRDPNEAVTNSTRIANDSVIVPDTNNIGPDPSRTDTSKTKMN